MHRVRQIALLAIISVLSAGVLSGCLVVAAAAGAGAGVAYVRGAVETSANVSPKEALEASRAALEEMDITIVSFNASDLDGQIIARTARDDRVRIDVKAQSPEITQISIRVGTLGDRERSMAIHDRIQHHLGR